MNISEMNFLQIIESSKSGKIISVLGIFAAILLLAVLFLSFYFMPLLPDDLAISLGVNDMSIVDYAIRQYNSWTGSLQCVISWWFVFKNPLTLKVFSIISFFVFVLNIYLVFVLTTGKKFSLNFNNYLILIFTLLIIVLAHPNLIHFLYWKIGSVAYNLPLFWSLLFLVAYRIGYSRSLNINRIQKVSITFLLFILGLWVGLGPLQFVVFAICGVMLYFLIKFKKKELRQIPLYYIFGLIGLFIGFLIMIKGPGNYVRLNVSGGAPIYKKIAYGFFYNANLIFNYLYALWPILLCILFFAFVYSKENFINNFNLKKDVFFAFIILGFACTSPFFVVGGAGSPRTATLPLICFTIAALVLVPTDLKFIEHRNFILLIVIFFISVAVVKSAYELKDIYTTRKEFNKREAQIKASRANGVNEIVVQPYTVKRILDLQKDTSSWINKTYCYYYNIKSIKINCE